ncbi:MAG: S8 family serine peptidase [Ignavibacteria bacterium]|nr:S8 family serine peptidase [Ignavibacteria bacterium]
MKIFKLLTFVLLTSICIYAGSVITNPKTGQKYISNELIIKFKESGSDINQKMVSDNQLKKALMAAGKYTLDAVVISNDKAFESISRIFSLKYSSDIDPLTFSNTVMHSALIEWAEPRYIYETSYTPNDPSLSSQWHLTKVAASGAWDVCQGDTNVIIGIVDTGIDWDHPDLAANIWHNWKEIPNNGIDDDNNGKIDDDKGWDFGGLTGTPDNNPMEDKPDHGTHVAGLASAVTNNGIGIASLGYKCKLMAVKTSQDNNRNTSGSPYIVYGYEGIIYAAANGCKVINCSWGGSGYSLFGADAVRFAIQKGATVVCAAGNDSSPNLYYPASYPGVLSVASTTSADKLSSFSNYGKTVDVSAPGDNVYSTWMDNTYTYLSGTSMASPLVAGLVALVRSKFPTLNALQAAERVRVTSDNIDALNTNYAKKMGYGRINATKALAQSPVYSIRIIEQAYSELSGDGDGILEPGETVGITIKARNYLDAITGATITLVSQSAYATLVNSQMVLPAMNSLDSVTQVNALSFKIAANTPNNTELTFLVNYSAGNYSDYEWLSVTVNPSYATVSSGKLDVTVTSKGNIAFNDYPTNLQGSGFKFDGSNNLLYEGALVMGNSATKIINCARNSSSNAGAQDTDFVVSSPYILKIPGNSADIEGMGIFNDNNAGSSKLGILCTLKTYTYTSLADQNSLILRYILQNTSAASISNFYAGLFLDWDLTDGTGDRIQYDTLGKLGYAMHPATSGSPMAGVAILTSLSPGFYGFLNDGTDGGINIYNGFTDAEKWSALSNGISKPRSLADGDISCMISQGPYTIAPTKSVEAAFALIAGYSVDDLRIAADRARVQYNKLLTNVIGETNTKVHTFHVNQNFPNPFNPSTTIEYSIGQPGNVVISIYNQLGELVSHFIQESKQAGTHQFTFNATGMVSGIYYCRINAGVNTSVIKMIYLK